MKDYSSVLIPLVATVALMLICFILYIVFGNYCCIYFHKRKGSSDDSCNEELAIPSNNLSNTSFACEWSSFPFSKLLVLHQKDVAGSLPQTFIVK